MVTGRWVPGRWIPRSPGSSTSSRSIPPQGSVPPHSPTSLPASLLQPKRKHKLPKRTNSREGARAEDASARNRSARDLRSHAEDTQVRKASPREKPPDEPKQARLSSPRKKYRAPAKSSSSCERRPRAKAKNSSPRERRWRADGTPARNASPQARRPRPDDAQARNASPREKRSRAEDARARNASPREKRPRAEDARARKSSSEERPAKNGSPRDRRPRAEGTQARNAGSRERPPRVSTSEAKDAGRRPRAEGKEGREASPRDRRRGAEEAHARHSSPKERQMRAELESAKEQLAEAKETLVTYLTEAGKRAADDEFKYEQLQKKHNRTMEKLTDALVAAAEEEAQAYGRESELWLEIADAEAECMEAQNAASEQAAQARSEWAQWRAVAERETEKLRSELADAESRCARLGGADGGPAHAEHAEAAQWRAELDEARAAAVNAEHLAERQRTLCVASEQAADSLSVEAWRHQNQLRVELAEAQSMCQSLASGAADKGSTEEQHQNMNTFTSLKAELNELAAAEHKHAHCREELSSARASCEAAESRLSGLGKAQAMQPPQSAEQLWSLGEHVWGFARALEEQVAQLVGAPRSVGGGASLPPREVTPRVWLGGATYDTEALRGRGVGAVVRLLLDGDLSPAGCLDSAEGVQVCRIVADDWAAFPICKSFASAHAFLDKQARRGVVTYIHCKDGINESAACLIGYLLLRRVRRAPPGSSPLAMLPEVWAKVAKARGGMVLTNRSFQAQLVLWAAHGLDAAAAEADPAWVPAVFRCHVEAVLEELKGTRPELSRVPPAKLVLKAFLDAATANASSGPGSGLDLASAEARERATAQLKKSFQVDPSTPSAGAATGWG